MTKIIFDSYELKTKTVPRIDDLLESLTKAKNYMQQTSIPSDFYYRTTYYNTINDINTCINKLKNIKDYINNGTVLYNTVLEEMVENINKLPTDVVMKR